MIHFVRGRLECKRDDFVVVEVGGIGFKIFVSSNVLQSLPQIGQGIKIFCYLYMRESGLELYGFLSEQELDFFEKLTSISGIGPKSALGVLAVAPIDRLMAAINEGRTELLTKASGIGKKTAERIVLELRGKLKIANAEETVSQMESDLDIEEALVGLGYSKQEARKMTEKIDPKITNFEERLKMALKKSN